MEALLQFIFALSILYLGAMAAFKIIGSLFARLGLGFNPKGEFTGILFAPLRRGFASLLAPAPKGMMNPGEEARFLNRFNKGLVLDGENRRLTPKESFNHIAILARTGGGKTSGYIIPNILKLAGSECSMVITDLSGELYEKTSGYLHKKGFKVFVLDPENLNESIGYNPLYYALSSVEIDEIAETIIRSANPGQIRSEDKIWIDGAKTLLFILIKVLVATQNHRFINLANLKYLLNSFGSDGSALDEVVFHYTDKKTFNEWKGFVSGNAKTMQSFVSTANMALNAIGINDNLALLSAYHSINLESFRERKSAIYIRIPAQKQEQYAFLLNLFYTQFFGVMMRKLPAKSDLPVYCLLDEFGNMQIPNFPAIVITIRKYGVSLSLVLQNFSQIEEKYGKNAAQSIMEGGIAGKLFFAGLDHETTSRLSEMIGEHNTNTIDALGQSHYEKHSILSSADIRTMGDDEALLFYANKKPLRLRIKPYYKDYLLHGYTKITPKSPSSHIPISEIEYINLDLGYGEA